MTDRPRFDVEDLRRLADEPWAHVQAHCDALRQAADEIERLRRFIDAAMRWYNAGLEGEEAVVATNTFFGLLRAFDRGDETAGEP